MSKSPFRLNQVLAVLSGLQRDYKDTLTVADRHMSSQGDMVGHRKRYTPRDEDGEKLPDTVAHVKARARQLVGQVAEKLAAYVDAVSSRDYTNTLARANVEIDGEVIFPDVPVPHLLFLEQLLTDLETWISRANTRDSAEKWRWNEDEKVWETAPIATNKTGVRKRAIVLYDATKEHPAQTQLIEESFVQGVWETVHFSGGMTPAEKEQLLKKIRDLLAAVRRAREAANMMPAENPAIGDKLKRYLFG